MEQSRLNFTKLMLVLLLTSFITVEIGYSCSPVPYYYSPVYLSYGELRNAVTSLPPRALVEPGKILVKGDYLYVNEHKAGVHIVDNSDPANPVNIGFINVPGNIDLAIKEDTLYVDSYVDLVAIDVSNHESVQESARLTNIYDYSNLFDNGEYYWGEPLDPVQGVVVDAVFVGGGGGGSCGSDTHSGCFGAPSGASGGAAATDNTGQSGSLARMLVNGETMYLLADSVLKSISVATPSSPVLIGTTEVGWDVETLYLHENNLLIGGQTGVRLYDLTDPDFPLYLSSFSHTWQCDPVVAEGDVAYVTLRGGFNCNGFNNQLDILDISDIFNPALIKSYAMENPYGLAIDNQTLFLADGYAGLKVFDVSDPLSIVKIYQFPDHEARDIILYQQRAWLTGPDGLYQYDYSALNNIHLISSLPVEE